MKTLYWLVQVTVLLPLISMSQPPSGGKPKVETVGSAVLPVSKDGRNLIVRYETGGRAYYARFCARPSDPGFASGVTVGFGYDLRFHSRGQIAKDWAGVATPREIVAMQSVSGLDGSNYRSIRDKVDLTWEEAEIVFDRVTLPRWQGKTAVAYHLDPDELHPHSNGAMVCMVFNRGDGISMRSRDIEKRAIRSALDRGEPRAVPPQLRLMKRLWPGHDGLQGRREDEAVLFEKGIESFK